MSSEAQKVEYPFTLKIETSTGQSVTVPIAFMTREQIGKLLQTDFKRIAEEAGVKGSRVYVEQAVTANYDNVLQEVETYLRRAALKTA
ncbi:MAG TPA: hypothetical protein VFP40_13250 [Terriglobales bacterium]|jgi:hypothetical protein|nr:hypothetical protein [Terriglobales bacterium]